MRPVEQDTDDEEPADGAVQAYYGRETSRSPDTTFGCSNKYGPQLQKLAIEIQVVPCARTTLLYNNNNNDNTSESTESGHKMPAWHLYSAAVALRADRRAARMSALGTARRRAAGGEEASGRTARVGTAAALAAAAAAAAAAAVDAGARTAIAARKARARTRTRAAARRAAGTAARRAPRSAADDAARDTERRTARQWAAPAVLPLLASPRRGWRRRLGSVRGAGTAGGAASVLVVVAVLIEITRRPLRPLSVALAGIRRSTR